MATYYVYLSHQPDGLTADMGSQDYVEASSPEEAAEKIAAEYRDLAPSEDFAGWKITASLLVDGDPVPNWEDNTHEWAEAIV